jgi:hypothetical protein
MPGIFCQHAKYARIMFAPDLSLDPGETAESEGGKKMRETRKRMKGGRQKGTEPTA